MDNIYKKLFEAKVRPHLVPSSNSMRDNFDMVLSISNLVELVVGCNAKLFKAHERYILDYATSQDYMIKTESLKIDRDFCLMDSTPISREAIKAFESGSNSLICMIWGKNLFVCNLGDSRAILCRLKSRFLRTVELSLIQLTQEDNVNDQRCRQMFEAEHADANNILKQYRFGVFQILGLRETRSLDGYMITQPLLKSEPQVQRVELSDDDLFVIIRSRVFWQQMKNEQAPHIVVKTPRKRIATVLAGSHSIRHLQWEENKILNIAIIAVLFSFLNLVFNRREPVDVCIRKSAS
ncbi:hypothetical protein LXL04_018351 [Taraxacum kok-saghyz]